MADDIETRRRRAHWRADHRGTKELDILIGRYAAEKLSGMDEPALALFEAFLAERDPDLQVWLLSPSGQDAAPQFADLVADVRRFHGLA